jgi:hypothetical protein
MWPGSFSPTAGPYGNYPLPPQPPLPDPCESQDVDRRLGLFCMCLLLDCCHDEDQEPCPSRGTHAHSGSPASGYLHPWEPGDESWREVNVVDAVLGLGGRNVRHGAGTAGNTSR